MKKKKVAKKKKQTAREKFDALVKEKKDGPKKLKQMHQDLDKLDEERMGYKALDGWDPNVGKIIRKCRSCYFKDGKIEEINV